MTYLQVLQRLSKIYNTSVYKSGQKWPKVSIRMVRNDLKLVSIIVVRNDLKYL
jgi:hypothetical protein